MSFETWLDTFLDEKGVDLDGTIFEVEGASGVNVIPLAVVVEHIKVTARREQRAIREMLVRIDFHNGDVVDYFRHLAGALAI